MRNLTYGLFVLTAKDSKDNGCIINTCVQVASEPTRLMISCQMGNLTREIIEATGVNPDTRVKDLTEQDVGKIRDYIDHHLKVEGDLRREVSMDIKRLMEIGCYRGLRHRRSLPVRGQNTKQNARTRKGPKKQVAGKKKAAK